jgi:hypothetical protein
MGRFFRKPSARTNISGEGILALISIALILAFWKQIGILAILFGLIWFAFKIIRRIASQHIRQERQMETDFCISEYNKGKIPIINAPFSKDNDEQIHFEIKNVQYLTKNNNVSDKGSMVVSSKRIIFLGNRRTHAYPYHQLMRVDAQTDEKYSSLHLQNKKDKEFRKYGIDDFFEFQKLVTIFNICAKQKEIKK